jgi:proteasome accessory factor A
VDSSFTLKLLEKRVPLFMSWPQTNMMRIGGDEFELGNLNVKGGPGNEFHRLPLVTENGGEVYIDCGHVEACTPETSNVVERVAYGEAMKQFCFRERYAHKLYCHCVDGDGNTFGGSHENYFTRAPRNEWPRLIPFLIARTLIAGTGNWVKRDKMYAYEISQRARFIQTAVGEDTTSNRGIINTRNDPLSDVRGWDRMHVIYSEPTH